VNKLTFQHWSSRQVFHQTPVALTYDDHNVYLKDKHLTILAWGAGSSSNKRGDFLSAHHINNEGSIRSTRQLCEMMAVNGATQAVFEAAATTFPHHQQFITEYFTRYNEVHLDPL
jgi:hypothetical protein